MSMRRKVTSVGRNRDGDITDLCGAWGNVTKKQARTHINAEPGAYHVNDVDIEVVPDKSVTDGFYLRTRGDSKEKNNLQSLPTCSSC